jgi:MscS family membrane protein
MRQTTVLIVLSGVFPGCVERHRAPRFVSDISCKLLASGASAADSDVAVWLPGAACSSQPFDLSSEYHERVANGRKGHTMAHAESSPRAIAPLVTLCMLLLVSTSSAMLGQGPAGAPPASPPTAHAPKDALGRDTPRGTVLGFLTAARRGDEELASQYLDTGLTGQAAAALAHQLFVVLDARLPARLAQISDAPEGSLSNPLKPNQDVVGTVSSDRGDVGIVVERFQRQNAASVWLFSNATLAAIPGVYEEIAASPIETGLPRFLTNTRLKGIRLFEWLVVLLGIPLFYFAAVLLNRILSPIVGFIWSRGFRRSSRPQRSVLPLPARLLVLVVLSRIVLSNLSLSLLVRQLWNSTASLLAIAGVVWLLILLTGEIEQYVRRRLPAANVAAATALVRLLRRAVDVLVVFVGLLVLLRHFGVDPTPALAGLGVGGIAVALAAQKTLENVIAGASLIFDQAVRVGDSLKMGEISGTVEHIGLRSTRIRTMDRTIVSVPNSQIANASLETISARDKYWFHPIVQLRYETTSDQLQTVIEGIKELLGRHPAIEPESVRVRLLRLGTFSLDVEAIAYLQARDWNQFLEIQERLLFDVTEIVNRAGTGIAFPSQTMYVASGPRA